MAQLLLDRGWTDARPLLGGFDAWVDAGLPTEAKPERTESPIEVAENIAKAEGDDAARPDL